MTGHRKAKEISKDLRVRRFHKENSKAGKISSTIIRWGDCKENPSRNHTGRIAARKVTAIRFLTSDLQEQFAPVHPQQHEPITQQNRGAAEEGLKPCAGELKKVPT